MDLHRNYRKLEKEALLVLLAGAIAAILGSGCTGSPGNFHLQQQNEVFATSLNISTKIDMLWVVDNSASMDIEQQRLRAGITAFANKYMQPSWDIRVGVITTDAYLANAAYQPYLNTVIPGSNGFPSTYVNGRIGTWVNPSYNPTLFDGTGKLTNGIKYGELVPGWGLNWAKLLPGLHDGPITAVCFEFMPYFLNGATQCHIRDDQSGNTGISHCVSPGGAETGPTQCVNTIENDTVHSGKAIINTTPPNGTPGDATWVTGLINAFTVNVSVGSAGSGSERGLQSITQFLTDNESSPSAFFRPGSLRSIIIISDEDDQTQPIPASPPAGYSPFTGYACDQAGIEAANGVAAGNNGSICCSNGSCVYGTGGLTCAPKTVDGYTYTIGVCPPPANLTPVSTIKSTVDSFFTTLDGGTDPNYFVVSIVASSGATLQALHTARQADDTAAGAPKITASDRADRYIDFANQVGNGSLTMDLGATDYTPILNAIGNSIIQKEGTFKIARAPTSVETMLVEVVHPDGSTTKINSTLFTVDDTARTLTITDLNTILSFKTGDKILINYEPSTVF
jgi:hypothetical protein